MRQVLGSILLLMLFAGGASGRPTPGCDARCQRAVRLYEQGKYAEAIEQFQAAYARRRQPDLLFNLGMAYLKLGQRRLALGYYGRYLKEAPVLTKQKMAEVRDRIERALDEIDGERSCAAAELEGLDPPPPAPLPDDKGATAPPPAAPPPIAGPPRVVQPVSRPSGRWSLPRLAVAGTIGGLLVATLVTSITLTALDGRSTDPCVFDGELRNCSYRFAPLYGAGYALSGVLAGGLALALTIPDRRLK